MAAADVPALAPQSNQILPMRCSSLGSAARQLLTTHWDPFAIETAQRLYEEGRTAIERKCGGSQALRQPFPITDGVQHTFIELLIAAT